MNPPRGSSICAVIVRGDVIAHGVGGFDSYFLRLLKMVLPLRYVSHLPSVKIVFLSLWHSLPAISSAILLGGMMWLMLATVTFARCSLSSVAQFLQIA